MKEEVNLCRCNNCDNTYIDQNPQFNTKTYPKVSFLTNLQYTENGFVCPVCNTDEYLTDDIESDWVLTDASCNQYRKTIIEDELYLFKEDRIIDPILNKRETFELLLSYEDFTYTELIEACTPFGYTQKQVSQWIDSGDEIELMLECIFELEN